MAWLSDCCGWTATVAGLLVPVVQAWRTWQDTVEVQLQELLTTAHTKGFIQLVTGLSSFALHTLKEHLT